MSFTSHLLAIAAGVAGVTLYQRARQSGGLSVSDGMSGGNNSSTDHGFAGATRSGSLDDTDSPNAGERISARGVGRGPLSSDSPEGLRSSYNLFGSDSQSGSQARTPGMPDLTRGA